MINDLIGQNSTQSVGNMPPLLPGHLLHWSVLQIMSGNPKYDQRGTHVLRKDTESSNLTLARDYERAISPGFETRWGCWCRDITLQSQSGTRMRKTNRPWPKSNQFWRWSGYISMPNFKSFLTRLLINVKKRFHSWYKDAFATVALYRLSRPIYAYIFYVI